MPFEFPTNGIGDVEEVAEYHITTIRQEEEKQLRHTNEFLLNNRILRLHHDRIRNLQPKVDREIRNLEDRRKVGVGYNRIAGALIDFAETSVTSPTSMTRSILPEKVCIKQSRMKTPVQLRYGETSNRTNEAV